MLFVGIPLRHTSRFTPARERREVEAYNQWMLQYRGKTLDKTVHGLLPFDLDNALIDREAAFVRFAMCFYEERLRNVTLMTRDEVVARMLCWDQDGYADRAAMFVKWAGEWPDAGLDPGHLLPKYDQRLEVGYPMRK